jgi:hypothetical protein
MTASAAPSRACSTRSARIWSISTSMRSAFAGRSGSSQARRRDGRVKDVRLPRPCGCEYRCLAAPRHVPLGCWREMRRTKADGFDLLSKVAVFG